MAWQFCPKCQTESITWYRVEGHVLTQWYCDNCEYTAEEDESQQRDCPHCKAKESFLLLKDADGFHRWCCKCRRFEPSNETVKTE